MNEEEMKTYTKILSNGVELPQVNHDIEFNLSDVQATSLTSWLTGKTKINLKRTDVVIIPVSWNNISMDDLNLILENTKCEEDGGSDIECFDPVLNGRVTKRMYRSNRKVVYKVYKNGLYADLSFELNEM